MENTPDGGKKASKSRVVLTNADRKAWKDSWAAMPPKPVYDNDDCCICGAIIPFGHKYVCKECGGT